MASTYSNLKIQLMATGENSGTWGNVTNDNLGVALEEAIVGSEDVTFASANVTLTLTNTNASQTARNLRLNLVGTTGGARDLIVPAIEKIYIVNNTCADAVTIKVTGQTGVAVPAGKTMYVYNNGTDCGDAITHLRNLTLATALPPGSGGTGINSVGTSGNVLTSNGTAWESVAPPASNNASALTIGTVAVNVGGTGATSLTTENVIIGNGTSAVKFVAPGTSGNVLTSNGTAWLSQAAGSAGGDYVMQVYTSPATWTKPAGLKAVKVTVIGGGGGGGSAGPYGAGPSGGGGGGGGGALSYGYIDAPAIPGPVSVTRGAGGASATAGGTSSFGPFISCTGGAAGGNAPQSPGAGGAGGSASGPASLVGISGGAGSGGNGGQFQSSSAVRTGAGGGAGGANATSSAFVPIGCGYYTGPNSGGSGGFGNGAAGVGPPSTGAAGVGYGSGGSGGAASQSSFAAGGAGSNGLIIVEEFY